jgi:hypothetical protein
MELEGRGDVRLLYSFGVPNHKHLQLILVVGQPAQDVSRISVGNERGRIVTAKNVCLEKELVGSLFRRLTEARGWGLKDLSWSE